MNSDNYEVPLIVGGLTAAILKFTQSSNTLSAGDILIAAGKPKARGDPVSLTVSITNTGDAFGGCLGLTLWDATGKAWNYNGEDVALVADPSGTFRDMHFPVGTYTKAISCRIPATFAPGEASLYSAIWNVPAATPPVEANRMAGFTLTSGNAINVPYNYNISITGISVT